LDGADSNIAKDFLREESDVTKDRIDLMTIQAIKEIDQGLASPIDDLLNLLEVDHCRAKIRSVERGLCELRSGKGEFIKDDDTFYGDLREELSKPEGDANED
jgi:hypothetical protein